MRRLIVNPGTDSAWVIPLPNGIASLGRAPENDLVLEHPSVSGHHCELMVMDSGVTIRDLSSSNGTFIDEQPVSESVLLPGQALRLGEVRLRLEEPVVPAPVAVMAGNNRCKYHPRAAARFFCPKCQGSFCEMCVNTRSVGGHNKMFCRVCAVECTPLKIKAEADQPGGPSFVAQIIGAFKYPLKGDGIVLICVGTILFLLVDGARFIAKFALIYGFIAVILLTIFGTGYLTAFLRRVINSTAAGDEEMPEWPEIEDFSSDILSPFLQLIGTVLFCFAPMIGLTIYAATQADSDSAWLGWATMGSMFFGCVYFPMAFTAVAMCDTVVAVNPLVVIPSILKVFREYVLMVIVLAVILVVRWLLQRYLTSILPVPLLPTIITSLIGLYLLVVEMRILGLLYRNKKDELAWF